MIHETLPKTNIATENGPLKPQKERRKYSNHQFSGAKMLVSGRVCYVCFNMFQKWSLKFSEILGLDGAMHPRCWLKRRQSCVCPSVNLRQFHLPGPKVTTH